MKLSAIWQRIGEIYPKKIRIIQKWVFWICINEEAYFIAKYFNLKLTKLDFQNIKAWFPDEYIKKWKQRFLDKWLWFIFCKKINSDQLQDKGNWFEIIEIVEGKYFNEITSINLEDYELTKQRILGLASLWLEEKHVPNFLLKEKAESLYIDLIKLFMRTPKQERMYIREKIEKLFLEILENIYCFMYNIWDRKTNIDKLFNTCLLNREFIRFLYKIGIIQKDTVYLDMQEKWLEILKICKWIKNNY
jgi:hypothetical protein